MDIFGIVVAVMAIVLVRPLYERVNRLEVEFETTSGRKLDIDRSLRRREIVGMKALMILFLLCALFLSAVDVFRFVSVEGAG